MKKKNILAILAAVGAVTLTAVCAVNGLQIQPIEAEASAKSIVFNGTTNLGTTVDDTQYTASVISTGQFATGTQGAVCNAHIINGKAADLTFGSSGHFLHYSASIAQGANFRFECQVKNITSVVVHFGASTTGTTTSKIDSYVTLFNGLTEGTGQGSTYLSNVDIDGADHSFTTTPSSLINLTAGGKTTDTFVMASVHVSTTGSVPAGTTVWIDSITVTWSC